MYTVGQSISLCPLLVSGAAQLFRSPLPDVQLAFHRVPLHRSPGSGQEVTCFQSSNDRHRSSRSSIHRHLISIARAVSETLQVPYFRSFFIILFSCSPHVLMHFLNKFSKKLLTNQPKFGASPFVKRNSFFGGASHVKTLANTC